MLQTIARNPMTTASGTEPNFLFLYSYRLPVTSRWSLALSCKKVVRRRRTGVMFWDADDQVSRVRRQGRFGAVASAIRQSPCPFRLPTDCKWPDCCREYIDRHAVSSSTTATVRHSTKQRNKSDLTPDSRDGLWMNVSCTGETERPESNVNVEDLLF